MRLADFIESNVEAILVEWEAFARSIWPEEPANGVIDPVDLRDDAGDILRATVSDMRSKQSERQRSAKSKGGDPGGESGARLDKASELHGKGRVGSKFELWAVVAEYRALRASVMRLWRESGPCPDLNDIDDVTRFNESIDQSLAEAIRSYEEQVERDRTLLLSNEQQARSDAETANRAKDMFLATLSHELRTPLSAIIGWIEILKFAGASGANLSEGLQVIERNARSQVRLIEEMLDVSRIVSGKLRMEIDECDLVDVIQAGIEVVRPTAETRGIKLDVQLDPMARDASCDTARVQQIVWNLLSNAIKFTHEGGTVRISLCREGSHSVISVSDNGRGISPDLLPHVFERFRQADSTTRRSYGGLGLGLSIVKHLAELHGGTVEAHSAGEGHGATFTVRLPARAEHPAEAEGALAESSANQAVLSNICQPPLMQLHGLHVLVVDDEADARRMLAKLLEGVGARVTSASSAAEALLLLNGSSQGHPHVLVSDLGMPNQDGYDLIREVRRRGYDASKIPAVALTGFAGQADAHEAAVAGFQVHITKPVNIYELTAAISSLAGRNDA